MPEAVGEMQSLEPSRLKNKAQLSEFAWLTEVSAR